MFGFEGFLRNKEKEKKSNWNSELTSKEWYLKTQSHKWWADSNQPTAVMSVVGLEWGGGEEEEELRTEKWEFCIPRAIYTIVVTTITFSARASSCCDVKKAKTRQDKTRESHEMRWGLEEWVQLSERRQNYFMYSEEGLRDEKRWEAHPLARSLVRFVPNKQAV